MWQSVRVPFSSFVPVFRARTMPGAPPLDASNICSIQLMLSKFEYDGALNPHFRTGQFELPLERITAYMAEPLVSWRTCSHTCSHAGNHILWGDVITFQLDMVHLGVVCWA